MQQISNIQQTPSGGVVIMIEFLTSFTQFVIATFVPLYFGMLLVAVLRWKLHFSLSYLSAFAVGLLFWFFLDTLNDAIQLGVNDGYSFGFEHSALLLLFVVGFVLLVLLSGIPMRHGRMGASESRVLTTGVLVAVGMGFHGIGEGLEFGGTSAGTSALTVLDAIGGYSGGLAYVLHKFLEATIVMTVFVCLLASERVDLRREVSHILTLGLMFGLPSALGEIVGYYAPIDSSYAYALGGGAALFVAVLALRPIWGDAWKGGLAYPEYVKMMLTALLGFLCLYGAAMFH
jgi:hypothetical protein